MGNAREIITKLAKQKVVENTIAKIAHSDLDADLCDLSQMVYVALLETKPEKIEHMDARNELRFYIVKIIKNMLFSKTSRFYYEIKKPREQETEISPALADRRPQDNA